MLSFPVVDSSGGQKETKCYVKCLKCDIFESKVNKTIKEL